MARLTSKAAFARLAGVSDTFISRLCKPGGVLHPACEGSRLDLDHDAAVAYLAAKGVDSTKATGAVRKRTADPPAPRPRAAFVPPEVPEDRPGYDEEGDESDAEDAGPMSPAKARLHLRHQAKKIKGLTPEEVARFPSLTLQQLVEEHGTEHQIKDWLDARKKIADIVEKDLKNEETLNRLIERELVEVHVFGAIDEAFRRLLTDTPKTLTRELYTASKTGLPVEEAEAKTRQALSKLLKTMKDKATRALKER